MLDFANQFQIAFRIIWHEWHERFTMPRLCRYIISEHELKKINWKSEEQQLIVRMIKYYSLRLFFVDTIIKKQQKTWRKHTKKNKLKKPKDNKNHTTKNDDNQHTDPQFKSSHKHSYTHTHTHTHTH